MYRGKTERGVSQEIPKPYLALLLYTHPAPRALDSCQSVGKLSDREHSSLIWMETGTKKGLACLQKEESVALLFLDFTILNCYILNY